MGEVKAVGVGAEGFQAEFGAKVDLTALVFSGVIVFGRDGHLATANQVFIGCEGGGDRSLFARLVIIPTWRQLGRDPGFIRLPGKPAGIEGV